MKVQEFGVNQILRLNNLVDTIKHSSDLGCQILEHVIWCLSKTLWYVLVTEK